MSYVHLPPYRVTAHPLAAKSDGVDWGVSSYGIPALWKKWQGEGVTVAVVDSGVAPHYALDEVVVDYRNFTTDSDQYDTLGHGTHCAGIIGAKTGNAKGIAPKVKIHSLKVLGHSGMGSNDAVAEAVRYATEIKCDIISMSLGSSRPDDHLHQAIKVVAFQEFAKIAGQGGLHHGIGSKRGLSKDAAVQFVDGKGCLKRHRILRPETAVVIKHGDAFCLWQEVW